jgi:ADP-ribose pyrophosphatase YjhB (NUDIX family)
MLHRVSTPLLRLWWSLSRGHTLGVRGLATDEAGRILLVRHTYQPGWFLPGGGVERGETAEVACRREMEEEAGVSPTALRLVSIHTNFSLFASDHVLFYRIDAWRPCAPDSAHEIAERGFFARDALPEGVTAATRRRIAEALDGAPAAPTW